MDPIQVASTRDALYVVHGPNASLIDKFSQDGQLLARWGVGPDGLPDGTLYKVRALAVELTDNLYVLDMDAVLDHPRIRYLARATQVADRVLVATAELQTRFARGGEPTIETRTLAAARRTALQWLIRTAPNTALAVVTDPVSSALRLAAGDRVDLERPVRAIDGQLKATIWDPIFRDPPLGAQPGWPLAWRVSGSGTSYMLQVGLGDSDPRGIEVALAGALAVGIPWQSTQVDGWEIDGWLLVTRLQQTRGAGAA